MFIWNGLLDGWVHPGGCKDTGWFHNDGFCTGGGTTKLAGWFQDTIVDGDDRTGGGIKLGWPPNNGL